MHVYVISPETGNQTKTERVQAHVYLTQALQGLGIPYRQVLGMYKGSVEKSYVCTGNQYLMDTFAKLAKDLNQESFLYSDSRRGTSLEFTDGTSKFIGKLRGVSKDTARTFDGYTTDGELYWVVY